jgi:hypothetical protein
MVDCSADKTGAGTKIGLNIWHCGSYGFKSGVRWAGQFELKEHRNERASF